MWGSQLIAVCVVDVWKTSVFGPWRSPAHRTPPPAVITLVIFHTLTQSCVVCMDMYGTACYHLDHLLFVSCSSVNSSSYNQMVNALLPVTQTSNSSLVVPSNASRYLDTPVDAVYLTVASVGAQCQLSNATVHVSTLERDVGKGHCSILSIYGCQECKHVCLIW